MTIPLAVASTVKTPGLYLVVDLLGDPANPGSAVNRALLMAPKGSAGTLVNNTEVRQLFGPDDGATAFGPGTVGHLAAKCYFKQNPQGQLFAISPTPSAGVVASAVQTFTGPATANSSIRFRHHGRITDVPWNNGESATTFCARAALAINAKGADLAFTVAANVGSLEYTAKAAGLWGNDILLNASILTGGGGIAITVNPAAFSAGTLEPDFTTALSTVATQEYRRIVGVLSNADATASAGTSNAARIAAHIDANETGNQALLQVGVVGHTGSVANAQAGAVARNNEAFEYVFGQNFEDLPGELAAAEAGDALKWVAIRANYNRIDNKLDLYGPRDTVAEKLTPAETESLLSNGVTPIDVRLQTGELFVVRPITTHSLNGSAQDYRAFDLSDTDGMYTVADDLRSALPIEFAHTSITPDLPAGQNRLPAGVTERKDIQAFVESRLGRWVDLGVVQGDKLDASITAGELIVEINASDASQVDIFLPLAIVKPLAKLGVVAQKIAS
jgi:phage tail sheath gpL-like